jgi:hypothetical protein
LLEGKEQMTQANEDQIRAIEFPHQQKMQKFFDVLSDRSKDIPDDLARNWPTDGSFSDVLNESVHLLTDQIKALEEEVGGESATKVAFLSGITTSCAATSIQHTAF